MKKQIIYTFEWWRLVDGKKSIPTHIEEELTDHAKERILSMSQQGFCSGELISTIGKIDYKGIWSTSHKEIKD